MKVKCTAAKFRNIMNPYTGEPIAVTMLVRDQGTPLFFASDTYSTTDFFPTVQQVLDMWDRVNGVGGTKRRDSLKCAYTGEDLHVEEVPGAGFHLVGGFNPKALASDDEFLYRVTMRDGKAVMPEPVPVTRATLAPEVPEHIAGEGDEDLQPSDDARRVAEGVVGQFKDQLGLKHEKTVVSMSGQSGKKRRGK